MKKFKKLMTFFAFIGAFVNKDLNKMAENKEQLDMSDEEKKAVDEAAKIEGFAETFMKQFNEAVASEENEEIIASIQQFMGASEDTGEEGGDGDGTEEGTSATDKDKKPSASAMVNKLIKKNASMEGRLKALEEENEKLANLPENEAGIQKVHGSAMKNTKIAHSKTHLFAKQEEWNAFEGRQWNANAKKATEGIRIGAEELTNWNAVNIQKVNDDLGAYARKNASSIFDLLMDGMELPANWEVISGVTDEAVFLSVTTGDITQGYKDQWLPNNKNEFEVIKNKIYDIQIDATWTVRELKQIERSYLQMFFRKTSSPYKDDFIAFLAEKLIRKARKEDKIAVFKGVYYKTPSDATKAGRFINKMNGFLKMIVGYRDVAYKSHALGKPTDENIYDYIRTWPAKLPYDFRVQPGLVIGLSDYWHKAYHRGRERAKGTNTDYKREDTFIEEYPNIRFVPHPQLEGQDFMYITTEDNLGVMYNVMGEESTLTMEKRKRNVDAYADYKFGPFVKALGATTADGKSPLGYDHQIFFSNDVEVLQDVYIPVTGNDATPSVKDHNALIIGSTNTADTDITKIDDVKAGQYVYLMGDSETNKSTVKKNTNIILDGNDFELTKGSKLVLRGLAEGKVIEISRSTGDAPVTIEKEILAPDVTTADATLGNHFVTSENTDATALTDIENAVAGEKYTIEGGSSTNATTIANGGNFFLTGAITLNQGNSLTVEYNGTKFVEFDRVVA